MLEPHEFYELFPTGMYYYTVDSTPALHRIKKDHLRVVHDRRIYVACDEKLEIEGLRELEAPEVKEPENEESSES